MKIESDEIIVITGQQGYGKTTLAKFLIKKLLENGIDVVIIDPNDEYGEFEGEADRIVPEGGDFSRVYEALKKAWEKGNRALIVDEADIVFPIREQLSGVKYDIVHRGRHRNLLRIFVVRRLANLNKDVVSQAKKIISFYQFLPNDLKYLKEFMGDYAELTKNLPKYHFIVFEQGEVRFYKPVTGDHEIEIV
ncbi:MAG: ATP-binding protein [Archaeoglobaceae archaeon]